MIIWYCSLVRPEALPERPAEKGNIMKNRLSVVCWIAAVILSDVMCAVVAYNYCDLLWGGKYAGYSAPPETAFLLAVPFATGVIICIVLAVMLRKKAPK